MECADPEEPAQGQPFEERLAAGVGVDGYHFAGDLVDRIVASHRAVVTLAPVAAWTACLAASRETVGPAFRRSHGMEA